MCAEAPAGKQPLFHKHSVPDCYLLLWGNRTHDNNLYSVDLHIVGLFLHSSTCCSCCRVVYLLCCICVPQSSFSVTGRSVSVTAPLNNCCPTALAAVPSLHRSTVGPVESPCPSLGFMCLQWGGYLCNIVLSEPRSPAPICHMAVI